MRRIDDSIASRVASSRAELNALKNRQLASMNTVAKMQTSATFGMTVDTTTGYMARKVATYTSTSGRQPICHLATSVDAGAGVLVHYPIVRPVASPASSSVSWVIIYVFNPSDGVSANATIQVISNMDGSLAISG